MMVSFVSDTSLELGKEEATDLYPRGAYNGKQLAWERTRKTAGYQAYSSADLLEEEKSPSYAPGGCTSSCNALKFKS
jgi:hypothetical protein